MDRQEAERIYEAGREVAVETQLNMDMDARIRVLEQQVIELEKIVAPLTRPWKTREQGATSSDSWRHS